MKKLLLFCSVIFFISCEKDDGLQSDFCANNTIHIENKIKGGSILQTWILANSNPTINMVEKTNSKWVSLSPIISIKDRSEQSPPFNYAFLVSDEVYKMREILPKINNSGIHQIMLKPLTLFYEIDGSGFWGDFYVETEEQWLAIESAYTELFYEFAKLSVDFPQVKILSIGTELKEFTKRRPQFFIGLIAKIRTDFPNLQLTYAANWDEYKTISFWGDLDYIGVNSYFPLVNKATPTVSEIKDALLPIKNDLASLSCQNNKPVLFTEYGFRSMDFAAWESWLLGPVTISNYNFEVQNNGYTAFYDTFWSEPWVSGGFFWEWRLNLEGEVNNPNNNGWYINGKPAEITIREQYAK